VNDDDKGEGRLGELANGTPLVRWLNPADGEPAGPAVGGGPYGSRRGDEPCARRLGEWTELENDADSADLMGTGCEIGVGMALALAGEVPASLPSFLSPSVRSRAERCCSFLLRRSIDMGSPGRT
jgi:hypothetical protein